MFNTNWQLLLQASYDQNNLKVMKQIAHIKSSIISPVNTNMSRNARQHFSFSEKSQVRCQTPQKAPASKNLQ